MSEPPAWSYHGDTGPAHWTDLHRDYALCGCGRAQSPIDLPDAAVDPSLPPLEWDYHETWLRVDNKGTTIEVPVSSGSVVVDNKSWRLRQFHFHSPAEHRVQGTLHDLELHLVHSRPGHKLVVGALFRIGDEHPGLAAIWRHLPPEPGIRRTDVNFEVTALLPTDRSYLTYDGSLTTPPCTEGVRWIMLTAIQEVSAEQVKAYLDIIGPSNRPVQPLNDRRVRRCQVG